MSHLRGGRFPRLACLSVALGAGASVVSASGQTVTAPSPAATYACRAPYLQDIVSNTRIVWDPPTNTAYGHNLWAPELHRLNDSRCSASGSGGLTRSLQRRGA